MGIKVKNADEAILYLKDIGSAAAAIDQDAVIVPFDGFIVAVAAQHGVVGVDGTGSPTQDVLYDVNKNNTTLISTKITYTHTALGVTPSSYGSFGSGATAPMAVSKGDVLSLDCDQILNGSSPTQPKNFTLAIKIARRSVAAGIAVGSVD